MKKLSGGKTLTKAEILFFICYFVLFPIFSDFEFNLREPGGSPTAIFKTFPYRLTSGLLYMLPYIIYYRFLLHEYFFYRRFLRFFVLLLLFLFLFNSYTALVNWLVSTLNFRTSNFHSAQGIDFNKALTLNFSVMYIIRELLVITALAYITRSVRQEIRIQQLEQQQLQTELNYLKVQLQPHFFFNTLNNIYALILEGSSKAASLVAKHADIMRYILYEASSPSVALSQEIAFLKNYVEVQAVRYSDKLEISFEVQGLNDRARMEPLLLLPFIENTFKHGAGEELDDGYIRIIISLVENELSAEICNSKPIGRKIEDGGSGIGIENAYKRLQMLYPGKYNLKIDQDHRNYEVYLTIILKPW